MQKAFKLLFIGIVFLNVGILMGCENKHIHEYKEEWATNEEYHYHECIEKDCFEISDKEKHLWDDGEIEDSQKIYTCTVCGALKNEKVEINDIGEDKWNSIIELSSFENVTFYLDATGLEGVGSEKSVVKIAGSRCLVDGVVEDEDTIRDIKELFIKTSLAIVSNFNNFKYDVENDRYLAKETIIYTLDMNPEIGELSTVKITAENVIVELDSNFNIYKITCKMTQEFKMNGYPTKFVLDVEFKFTDYGTTVIE